METPNRAICSIARLVQWIARTQLLRRDLSSFELVALMIDGVHFAEHVVLAPVGIREHPQKHLLGLKEGVTENAAACKAGAARSRLQGVMCYNVGPQRAVNELNPFVGRKVADAAVSNDSRHRPINLEVR